MHNQIAIVLFLLIACSLAQKPFEACSLASNSNHLLQFGRTLFASDQTQNEYTYTQKLLYSAPSGGVEIAYSPYYILGFDQKVAGFGFSLNGQYRAKDSTILFKLIIPKTYTWTTVQIYWLISSRNDMALGAAQIGVAQWSKGVDYSRYDSSISIKKTLPTGKYKAAVFISGLENATPRLRLSILSKNVRQEQFGGTVLQIGCGMYPSPLVLTLSYVIFPEAQITALPISYHEIVDNQDGDTSYRLVGPVSFSDINAVIYNEIRIGAKLLTCIGSGKECSEPCISRQKCEDFDGNLWADQCVFCRQGQSFKDGLCTSNCAENQIKIYGNCICQRGFTRKGNTCVSSQPKSCPTNSYPSADNTKCICSKGYYWLQDQCLNCHSSCSECTGQSPKQCLSCSDPSRTLKDNQCVRQCQPGFYFSSDSPDCHKCRKNCASCAEFLWCNQCDKGYKLVKQNLYPVWEYRCQLDCGDGITLAYEECDDGNTVNGDGCSVWCKREEGWSCTVPAGATKSTCKYFKDKVWLTTYSPTFIGTDYLIGVTLTNLPACITANQCQNCHKLLKLVFTHPMVISTSTVTYVAGSAWKFIIKAELKGYDSVDFLRSNQVYMFISLDQQFKGCLRDDDYGQQEKLQLEIPFHYPPLDELTLADLGLGP